MRAIEAIEELDDVQEVFHNVKISEEALAAIEAA
jgi:transcriptional/translational regulatory protein YebC/TACO1